MTPKFGLGPCARAGADESSERRIRRVVDKPRVLLEQLTANSRSYRKLERDQSRSCGSGSKPRESPAKSERKAGGSEATAAMGEDTKIGEAQLSISPSRRMTSIHSLPLELLRHTLSFLLLEEGEPQLDLAAAALVHSVWRSLAQALLTEEIDLGYFSPAKIDKFRSQMPVGWACRSFRLDSSLGGLPKLLGRARPGCLRNLQLADNFLPQLFELQSLSRKWSTLQDKLGQS